MKLDVGLLAALVALDGKEVSLPPAWRETLPALFDEVCKEPLRGIEFGWVLGFAGDLRNKQVLSCVLREESAPALLQRLTPILEQEGFMLQSDGQGFLLAIHPEQSVLCEANPAGMRVELSITPQEIPAGALNTAFEVVPMLQPLLPFLPFLRVRSLSVLSGFEQPLSVQMRAYRKVEHIGEDDAWLAAHQFEPLDEDPSILHHKGKHGPLWLLWQGEKIALYGGSPPS